MHDYILPRSGQRPLRFTGDLISNANGMTDSGPTNTRWWYIEVFRTQAGRYVLRLTWNTRWQGEEDYHAATVHDSPDEVMRILETLDPLERLVGFPAEPAGKYADRQRHVETALRQKWGAQVSEIAGELGVAEEADAAPETCP